MTTQAVVVRGRFPIPIPKIATPDLEGVYPTGRRCDDAGCSTFLSRYNPGPGCWLHGGWNRDEAAEALAA